MRTSTGGKLTIAAVQTAVMLFGCAGEADRLDAMIVSDSPIMDLVDNDHLAREVLSDIARDSEGFDSQGDLCSDDCGQNDDAAAHCIATGWDFLASDPETLDMGIGFVDEPLTIDFAVTNHNINQIRISGLQLDSPYFSLVERPSVPILLGPCESLPFRVQANEIGQPYWMQEAILTVSYSTFDNIQMALLIRVSGAKTTRDKITCVIKPNFGKQYVSFSESEPRLMYVHNAGTGQCVVSEIGVAECLPNAEGFIECPSPADARPDPRYRLEYITDENGNIPVYVSSSFIGIHVGFDPEDASPRPWFGMLYLKATEKLTSRVSNFPESELRDDGTEYFDWNITHAD